MTSPGLIDLSISRMTPLIRLLTVFCKPKPIPRPTAPPTTASPVRSTPTLRMAISTASATSTIFSDFVNRTWTVGDNARLVLMRASIKLVRYSANDNKTASATVDFMTV